MKTVPNDPDGYPIIPLPPELDLGEEGFDVIELGVRNLVETLWRSGYRTVCSCAGHLHDLEPFPWVAIPIDIADSVGQLLKLAEAVASFNMSLGEDGGLPKALDTWVLVPIYGPSGFAVYLQSFDANVERSPQKLSQLRKASDHLARYIENACKDSR